MSFEIHDFKPLQSTDGTAGLLVLRFSKPASPDRLGTLTSELAEAGVLEPDRDAVGGGTFAALPWRVPSEAELESQRAALSSLSDVSEAWAFSQSAETDLTDWFAPKWRAAPPTADHGLFADTRRPEHVSWEGFGVSLTFSRELDDGDRDVIRALAELWLTAYSDRTATERKSSPEGDSRKTSLGSACYRRAVIAPHGASGVIVGLEGLSNPGTDDQAIGHLLWLAEQVGRVLPQTGVEFMSLLPQAGESGETIAPAKVLERATREWSNDLAGALEQDSVALEDSALSETVQSVEVDQNDEDEDDDDDDDDEFSSQLTVGVASATATDIANLVETLGPDAGHPGSETEPAPAVLGEAAAAAATDEVETLTDEALAAEFDDEAWAVETKHLPRADEMLADALSERESEGAADPASQNGVSTHVTVEPASTAENVEDAPAETVDVSLHTEETIDVATHDDARNTDDEETAAASGEAAIIAALEGGDLASALAAFDATDDKAAGAEILLDVIEDLDASDWDDLQPILDLGERIIAAAPERSAGHLQLINALCRLGRGDDAIQLGLANIERADVLYETFERLCVFRRVDEAAGLIDGLREHGHEGVGDHYYNLGCKLHMSQPEIAVALYRGAIACGSPRPQADINCGVALMKLGRHEEAITASIDALSSCGDEPNLWANLIDVQTRLDHDGLEDSLERAKGVLSRCAEEHDTGSEGAAACESGCGALLSDIIDALLLKGRADEAVALTEEHKGDGTPTARVICGLARAMAVTGDTDGARTLLDGLTTEDATSTVYYRARANVMFLAGKTDAAVGLACAAIMTDNSVLELLKRDPLGEAIANLSIAENGDPPRPPTLPDTAVWVASDSEWELGDRDDDGEKHGAYRYYRADGTLCNECTMVHGQPHGDFLRFHESGEVSQKGSFEDGQLHGTRTWLASDVTTSEQMHNEQILPAIRRSEMDYLKGRVVGVRHYDGEGTLCAPNGEPYPDRPGEVTAEAFFRAEDNEWVFGEVDSDGNRRGTWKRWNAEGVLLEQSEFVAGDRHGSFKAYFADGSLSVEGQYSEGEKSGTFVYQRRGEDEHEDFPVAASSVSLVEESHDTQVPGLRFYDKSGRETTIAGTPLEEWAASHPSLASWFNELWQVPWPELDDASGNAHRVPHLLVGLVSSDDELSSFMYRALYWHLYHQGTVYSGTAAAMPFLIRLAQSPDVSQLGSLCDFIRHAGSYPQETLDEAAESGNHAVVSTNEALRKRIDAFVDLLASEDPAGRAAAGAVLCAAIDRFEEMSSHLSGALAGEDSEMVRASHMFSLARFGTPEALFVVEAQLDGGSPLVGATAAMALVMARGDSAGERVSARLTQALVEFSDDMAEAYAESPWSDDHLVTELTQALHYSCEGNTALDRLASAFSTITKPEGTAAVAAALMIASSAGDGLTDEVRSILLAVANCDSLWQLGDALTDLLNGYELPITPDGLRELVS